MRHPTPIEVVNGFNAAWARGDIDKATALEVAPSPEQLKMAFKGIKVATPGIL